MREFTYSDDLAKIIVYAFNNFNGEHPINVGNPNEYSILRSQTLFVAFSTTMLRLFGTIQLETASLESLLTTLNL
jgi:hypothetical protein